MSKSHSLTYLKLKLDSSSIYILSESLFSVKWVEVMLVLFIVFYIYIPHSLNKSDYCWFPKNKKKAWELKKPFVSRQKCWDYIEKLPFLVIFPNNLYIFVWIKSWDYIEKWSFIVIFICNFYIFVWIKCWDYVEKWPFMVIFLYNLCIFVWIKCWNHKGCAKSSVTNRFPKFYPRYILKCFTALEWCVE